LKSAYRDILKHSAVYGVGQILARLASFLLLPLYTSYLTPVDYGAIAILDLTAGVLAILVGAGMVSAANRHHFEAQSEAERDQVWWTSLTFVVVIATAIVVPLWFARGALARLTLGWEVPDGVYFYALVLPTLWFGVVGGLPDAYLRIRKWSSLSVALSMARLLLNIGLNVYFLVVLRLGVAGILWGNLITGAAITAIEITTLVATRGSYAFHWELAEKLWRFGSPFIVTALLQIVMHQADRFFLRLFLDMHDVGIYSLAYTIGQAVNTLCLLPFASIWGVVVYEVAEQPDAKRIYARIFEYFAYGLMLVMLGVSLYAKPIIAVMAAPEYAAAAELIPIVCLAYLFFSLSTFFTVPALLSKKTNRLVPGNVVGATVNVVGNLLLIPRFGMVAAAWVSVLTFFAFATTDFLICRRIDRIPYPLVRVTCVVLGMAATYLACGLLTRAFPAPPSLTLALAALLWTAWAMLLMAPPLRRQLTMRHLPLVE
jgi:O-antigen/teichoic acid export membrane protein